MGLLIRGLITLCASERSTNKDYSYVKNTQKDLEVRQVYSVLSASGA